MRISTLSTSLHFGVFTNHHQIFRSHPILCDCSRLSLRPVSSDSPAMGLWTLLEGLLLLANALAILNEDRFLAPKGLSFQDISVGRTKNVKGQVIGLIYAVQYMRVPLILLNTITIIVKLVSG